MSTHLSHDLSSLVRNHPEPIAVFDKAQKLLYGNAAYQEMTGLEKGSDYPYDWEDSVINGEDEEGIPWRKEVRRHPTSWEGQKDCWFVQLSDSSPTDWGVEETERLAFEDELTGLPTYHLIAQFIDFTLVQARRYERAAALVVLDLDRFKRINEVYGDAAGDAVLAEAANRLQTSIRSSDMICRRGEDEFVILLTELSDQRSGPDAPKTTNSARAATVASRLLRCFDQSFRVGDEEIEVRATIGVSLSPEDATTPEEFFNHAQAALSEAKSQGRNCYKFYTQALQQTEVEYQNRRAALEKALESESFELYFQPVFDLRTQQVVGAESLLRWRHQGEIRATESFLAVAERSGLIVPLGHWAMEHACRQHQRWLQDHGRALPITINLSPRQLLDGDTVKVLESHRESYEVPVEELILETDERVLQHHPDVAYRRIRALKESGFTFQLDSFGMGPTSLVHLRELPLSGLKLAPGFSSRPAWCRAFRTLTSEIGLKLMAKQIETPAQLRAYKELGFDQGQGMELGNPVTADEFAERFLKS